MTFYPVSQCHSPKTTKPQDTSLWITRINPWISSGLCQITVLFRGNMCIRLCKCLLHLSFLRICVFSFCCFPSIVPLLCSLSHPLGARSGVPVRKRGRGKLTQTLPCVPLRFSNLQLRDTWGASMYEVSYKMRTHSYVNVLLGKVYLPYPCRCPIWKFPNSITGTGARVFVV